MYKIDNGLYRPLIFVLSFTHYLITDTAHKMTIYPMNVDQTVTKHNQHAHLELMSQTNDSNN